MEMNVRDDRHVRHALADLLQSDGCIIVGNGEPDNLAARVHHLFDLCHSGADVRSISLCHRLNSNGSVATDLNVLDLNWSRFAHGSLASEDLSQRISRQT